MRKTKIQGMKPFNEFYFRSCYYHQLLAALSCVGVDKDSILISSFIHICKNFVIDDKDFFEDKKLQRKLGFKLKKCNITERSLIKSIDKGRPIVVGVDSFYLGSRPGTYLKRHVPHFVTVYGYDLDNDLLNVVDHDYYKSMEYKEKMVSLSNILMANNQFKKGVLKRKTTCRKIIKIKAYDNFSIWKDLSANSLMESRDNSYFNLENLKMMFYSDLNSLEIKSERICSYLLNLKTMFYTISNTSKFLENQEKKQTVAELISDYSSLVSLFWKMRAQNNFKYAFKQLGKVIRKINEMVLLEEKIYGYLMEEANV